MADRRTPVSGELEGVVARVFARRATDADWIRREREAELERVESMRACYDELADALADLAVDGTSASAASRASHLGALTGITADTQKALVKTAVVLVELGLSREQVAAKVREVVTELNRPTRRRIPAASAA